MFLLIAILYIAPPSTAVYKEKIARIESKGDYCATNGTHYGKYQFSMATLRGLIELGYLDPPCEGLTVENFLNNPVYQERAMNALIHHQWQIIKKMKLWRYKGRYIRGVKITTERLFAGLHFCGPIALRHFLRTGSLAPHRKRVKVDRFGTTVITFMKRV